MLAMTGRRRQGRGMYAVTGGAGFTLVELLVVVAVALILFAIAIPSLRNLIDGRRVRLAADELVASMQLARSEAIHRGERVDLVAVNNDWRSGWTVFVDRNGNGLPDEAETVVMQHPGLPASMHVESQLSDGSRNYLAYHPSGRSQTHAHAQQAQFGTFRFRIGSQRRNIVLNMLGRPRLCTPAADSDSC